VGYTSIYTPREARVRYTLYICLPEVVVGVPPCVYASLCVPPCVPYDSLPVCTSGYTHPREAERPLRTLIHPKEAERPLRTLKTVKEAERPLRTLKTVPGKAERPLRTVKDC